MQKRNNGSGPLPVWPQRMIESTGDYRNEAHIETLVGNKLYEKQNALPSLPVPEIRKTLSMLMDTVLPLAESEDEANSFIKAVKDFEQSDFSKVLQKRLLHRKNVEFGDSSSWLSLWWNQLGYLQVRDPVVINVSYFFHFRDDNTIPGIESTTSLGVLRAAALLHNAAIFRKSVASGHLNHEEIGRKDPKTPLCSVAYKYMFNACRIPLAQQDSYRIYDPSQQTHCIVARKGYFFSIEFVDQLTHEPLFMSIIEESLKSCIKIADEMEIDEFPKLGWLTSSDRDIWANNRKKLLELGGEKMDQALERLESGALLICLDDDKPKTTQQCGEIFWHGGKNSGGNRWFDKSIQIMCTENGKVGLIGEHSMMDG